MDDATQMRLQAKKAVRALFISPIIPKAPVRPAMAPVHTPAQDPAKEAPRAITSPPRATRIILMTSWAAPSQTIVDRRFFRNCFSGPPKPCWLLGAGVIVLGGNCRFFSCSPSGFLWVEASLVGNVSGSGEIEFIDNGFRSGLRLPIVIEGDCAIAGFGGTAGLVGDSRGVEYKLDWFFVAPKNFFSSSLSSDEIIETCDMDLAKLFFRLAMLSPIEGILLAVSLIVGWIFSSCGSMVVFLMVLLC